MMPRPFNYTLFSFSLQIPTTPLNAKQSKPTTQMTTLSNGTVMRSSQDARPTWG